MQDCLGIRLSRMGAVAAKQAKSCLVPFDPQMSERVLPMVTSDR